MAAAAAASIATVAAAWTAAAGATAAAAAGGGGGGGGSSGNEGSVGTGGLQPRAVSLRYFDQSNTGQIHCPQPRPPIGPQKLIKYWSNTGRIHASSRVPPALRSAACRPSCDAGLGRRACRWSSTGQIRVLVSRWSNSCDDAGLGPACLRPGVRGRVVLGRML